MWDRLKRLLRAEKGSIFMMGALSLVSVLGMTGIAAELGQGYAAKLRNQRISDMAALGAALAFQSTQSLVAAAAAANDIVQASGLATTTATVTPDSLTSPTQITVSISTIVPVRLTAMLTRSASYTVTNAATVSLVVQSNSALGCITALGTSGNTVAATGGASISANGCAITTNGTASSDNSSAKITAKQITAASISDAAASYGQNAITTTPTAKNIKVQSGAATDSVKTGNAAVQAALCQVNKLTGTSDPDYSGGNTTCTSALVVPAAPATTGSTTDWTTGYNKKGGTGFDQYETADYSCSYSVPAGTYTVRNLKVTGGCTVTFASGSTLKFDSVDASGSNVNFGDGDITVSGNFNVNADNAMAIGNGNHSFGQLTLNGGKKLTVGTGNFLVAKGINVSGGTYLKVNIAAGNTVTIGNDGSGNAIVVGGGSQVCFTSNCAAPTVTAGTFSANGSVNVAGGGSLVVFPQAVNHIINGDMIATAGVIFGAGTYIIKGNFQNTTGSGSDTMQGTNVTFALGGTINFGGGAHFDLAAPTSASSFGITDVLIATKSSAGTVLSAGATGLASGLIYAPNSALTSSGGSAISSNGDACMMLVVLSVSVSGSGTVNTANCAGISGGTSQSGTLALVK